MTSAKLTDKEIIQIIHFALNENNIDMDLRANVSLEFILEEYKFLCAQFQKNYVIGELDTFKRASCLLVAINKYRLCKDKRINASIALDAAYKMCEKPYWNVGANYDIPKKMEEVDFKAIFADDMDMFNTSKDMLILSLLYENGSPLNYNLNLELLYQLALQIKHRNDTESVEKNNFEQKELQDLSLQSNEGQKQKIKFLNKNIFRKH